jgi:hypothetical protein
MYVVSVLRAYTGQAVWAVWALRGRLRRAPTLVCYLLLEHSQWWTSPQQQETAEN